MVYIFLIEFPSSSLKLFFFWLFYSEQNGKISVSLCIIVWICKSHSNRYTFSLSSLAFTLDFINWSSIPSLTSVWKKVPPGRFCERCLGRVERCLGRVVEINFNASKKWLPEKNLRKYELSQYFGARNSREFRGKVSTGLSKLHFSCPRRRLGGRELKSFFTFS